MKGNKQTKIGGWLMYVVLAAMLCVPISIGIQMVGHAGDPVAVLGTNNAEAKSYRNSFSWTLTVDSVGTTSGRKIRTDSLTGGTTGAPIFLMTGLEYAHSGLGGGQFEIQITKFDSTKGGTMADTTYDTVYCMLYTAWLNQFGTATSYPRANETILDTAVIAKPSTARSKSALWQVPSTAVIGDVIYARIQTTGRPKNVADTLAITYKGYATWMLR